MRCMVGKRYVFVAMSTIREDQIYFGPPLFHFRETKKEKDVMKSMSRKIFIYAGNWTVQAKEAEAGIGIYEYHEADGSLTYLDMVRKDIVAGCICADHRRGILYAVDEQQNSPAFRMQGGGGRVIAFSVDEETGALTKLGTEQPSFGTLPPYLAQDGTGDWLVVPNHGDKQVITKITRNAGGEFSANTDFSDVTIALFELNADGAIQPPCDVMAFPPDQSRYPVQTACFHAVYFAPDGAHFIVSNMKQDQLVMMSVDREQKKLRLCSTLECPRGNWPRHGSFHPTKPLFYMNNEHAMIVNVVEYGDDWSMRIVQTLDSTPELELDTTGERILQSDLKIGGDGRFVYNFCRGTDTVAVFAVREDGLLSMIQSLKLEGKGPRGAAISPDGRFILSANMRSGTIETLAVAEDGTVSLTGISNGDMQYPGAVCFY